MKLHTKETGQEYLDDLFKYHNSLTDEFDTAKRHLYELQVSTEYGGWKWEDARKRCYDLTQQMIKVKREIERVRKAKKNG